MQSKEILSMLEKKSLKSEANINSFMSSKFKLEKEMEREADDLKEENLFEDIELSRFTIMSDLYEESIEDIINELGE